MPPDIDTLGRRLRSRATDSEETISRRLEKAEYEMGFAGKFDAVVINDRLEDAVSDVRDRIKRFI